MRAALIRRRAAEDNDLAGQHARHAAKQYAAAAMMFGEEIAPDEDRHPPAIRSSARAAATGG